jgi:haloalkane dehalogenase
MRTFRMIVMSFIIGVALSACEEFPFFPDDNENPDPADDTIEALRTPDERFEGLPGYTFEPHYVTVMPGHLRMHYIDEGPANGPLVMLLHGNPAWTYLIRDMVQPLVDQGYRVVAPDLIGFGRSDKPIDRAVHTYDNQEAWMTSFVKKLDLQDIHVHMHNWGAGIGLRVAIRNEERFASVATSNGALAVGDPYPESFIVWRDSISQVVPSYAPLFQIATVSELTPQEAEAYEAPYPSDEYKAGPRQLPQSVPDGYTDPEAIENSLLLEQWRTWEKPFITLSSDTDPAMVTADSIMANTIPGAAGQPHAIISNSAHYPQEDNPEELTERLIHFFGSAQ